MLKKSVILMIAILSVGCVTNQAVGAKSYKPELEAKCKPYLNHHRHIQKQINENADSIEINLAIMEYNNMKYTDDYKSCYKSYPPLEQAIDKTNALIAQKNKITESKIKNKYN